MILFLGIELTASKYHFNDVMCKIESNENYTIEDASEQRWSFFIWFSGTVFMMDGSTQDSALSKYQEMLAALVSNGSKNYLA